jgi:hypothetical protein
MCTFEKGGRRGAHAIHGSFYEPRFFFVFVLLRLEEETTELQTVL